MAKTGLKVVFCTAFLLVFGVSSVYAIPAWGKKYSIDCSACHSGPMYKLTPMGTDFLRSGHRVGTDEPSKKLDELFSINTKLRGFKSPDRSTFEVHAFSIYTGGPLSKKFSYFTEMYLYENTGKTSGAVNGDFGRSKLADAYLMFTSAPDKNSYTTVRFGQISPSQLNIYWNSGPRYSETRPYVVNNSAVSPNTYRPFMRNFGFEVAQTIKSAHLALGILNGTGAGSTNMVDNNKAKDLYGTLDVALGNSGSAVGVYGYRGRGLVVPTTGATWENDFHRVGAFGQLVVGRVNLAGVVTNGREELNIGGATADNRAYLAEADVVVSDRVAVFGRYDYFDPNTGHSNDQISGPVLGATYRFFENGRVVGEYHRQGKSIAPKPNELRLEVAFAF